MNCYKCQSSTELSIRGRYRDGRVRQMICKPCRRAGYHKLKNSKSPHLVAVEREELRRIKWMTEWDIKAWKINNHIMRKYA